MTDYLDTPAEAAARPDVRGAIQRATAGNTDAARWLWRCQCFTQMFDDLIDRDKIVDKAEAIKALVDFITECALNPWWLAHRERLHALLVSGALRWVDGDKWAGSADPRKQALAPAIRCADTDLLIFAAYLCRNGDFTATLNVPDLRTYDTPN